MAVEKIMVQLLYEADNRVCSVQQVASNTGRVIMYVGNRRPLTE
jgi:hypothetical protein